MLFMLPLKPLSLEPISNAFALFIRHGSLPNAAECKLVALSRQCLVNDASVIFMLLQHETAERATDVNDKHRAVDWQLPIDGAHLKFKHLYPKIKI